MLLLEVFRIRIHLCQYQTLGGDWDWGYCIKLHRLHIKIIQASAASRETHSWLASYYIFSLLPACQCNGNAEDCMYQEGLMTAVCINCTNNTTGSSCTDCLPEFYPNSTILISDPDYCKRTQTYRREKCSVIYLMHWYISPSQLVNVTQLVLWTMNVITMANAVARLM